MNLVADLILLIGASLLLIRTTREIIFSLDKISRHFALSEFSTAFILMAVATSLPEVFVGVTSALEGASLVSLGNVLGSNILDLTLVAGIVALMSRQVVARSLIVRRDALYMAFYLFFPFFLLLDKTLSRYDGLLLILIYFLYLLHLLNQRSSFARHHNHVSRKQALQALFLFVIATFGLLIAADLLVRAAKNIALDLGMGIGWVGLFFVALGTSLPEIVFELKSIRLNHANLALGDLVGSVVTNSTLVLGITALISPIVIENLWSYLIPFFYLCLIVLLFEIFIRSEKRLVAVEGLILILIYIFFLLTELGFQFLQTAPR